ncbi:alpha/beta hydrolase [Desulfocurvus sp. DL9XJH121]
MSAPQAVTFVSGWAGYAALMPRVAETTRFVQPFADLDEAGTLAALRRGGDLLAAWSTGAHMVLKHADELFPLYGRIVLFAPFLSFCAHTPRDTVRAMLENLASQGPERTVRAFWRACGAKRVDFVPPLEHCDRLCAGLRYLLDSLAAVEPGRDGGGVRILHGAGDRVVPMAAGREVASLLAGAWLSIMDFGHLPPERIILDVLHEETGCPAFQPRG